MRYWFRFILHSRHSACWLLQPTHKITEVRFMSLPIWWVCPCRKEYIFKTWWNDTGTERKLRAITGGLRSLIFDNLLQEKPVYHRKWYVKILRGQQCATGASAPAWPLHGPVVQACGLHSPARQTILSAAGCVSCNQRRIFLSVRFIFLKLPTNDLEPMFNRSQHQIWCTAATLTLTNFVE